MTRYFFASGLGAVTPPPAGGITYAADFIAAVTAAGGSLSSGQQTALYSLESSWKAAGLLSSISRQESLLKAAYPMAGSSDITHSFNFVDPEAYRLTWLGNPSHTANGVQFNGVNQCADTGFASNTLPVNSNHLAFYADQATVDPDRGGQGTMGVAVDDRISLALIMNRGSANYYVAGGDSSLVAWSSGAHAGLLIGSRSSLSFAALYYGGQLVATSTSTLNGSLSGGTITIGRLNVGGQYSQVPCSFATIGLQLSEQQASDLTTTIQQFQTTLGRAR